MSKIIPKSKVKKIFKRLRSRGKKIVFTNGTFDFLHIGHVTYLQKAKKLGHLLVVGVNSDASVRSYKAPGRPINPEGERMKVLAALECVDYVIRFSEPTPLSLIKQVKPHVLVKGADWKKSQIAGASEVVSWGGKVKLISLVSGRSTTRLIKKLKRVMV